MAVIGLSPLSRWPAVYVGAFPGHTHLRSDRNHHWLISIANYACNIYSVLKLLLEIYS